MGEVRLWILHLLAGIVVLVFLAIHMGIMHMESVVMALGVGYEHATSWESVVLRNKQAFYTVTYIVLLGAALYHGCYGLRNILFELNIGKGTQRTINWLTLLSGTVLFVYGTYAAIAAYVG